MAFRFTKELGTIQGAILYIQTSSDEEFQDFKKWFKMAKAPIQYRQTVFQAIKDREQKNA